MNLRPLDPQLSAQALLVKGGVIYMALGDLVGYKAKQAAAPVVEASVQQLQYMYGVQQKLLLQLVELHQENNTLLQLLSDKMDIIGHQASK